MMTTLEPNPMKSEMKVTWCVEGSSWVTKKIYRPGIVKSYNNFMGGEDLSDQMTAVNKSKKQKRWYLRIFLNMVLLSIYNAYILEEFKRPQTPRRRRKRDLLSFKEDLLCAVGWQLPTATQINCL